MKIYYVKRACVSRASRRHTQRTAGTRARRLFGAVINQLREVALSERDGDKAAAWQ